MQNNFLVRGMVPQNKEEDESRDKNNGDFLSLRPQNLGEYLGQINLVKALSISIKAARQRGEALDHVLFHGPPGLGKTTLAHIIANHMNRNIIVTSGPALEKGGDLIGILTHLSVGDVFFIDEIHRIPKNVEEFLYPAMEDFAVDFIFDKGIHARSHRYQLKKFTLVGSTTRVGSLSTPLRDRFGIVKNLDYYNLEDLALIVKRSADFIGIRINPEGALELAERSRGTPRIINRLLNRVRDYAQVNGKKIITREIVERGLYLEGIDKIGLTSLDRQYLRTIITFYNGGPVGIEAISATLQEEPVTLIDMVEPFMLKNGFIVRTASGRKATKLSYDHLNSIPNNMDDLTKFNY